MVSIFNARNVARYNYRWLIKKKASEKKTTISLNFSEELCNRTTDFWKTWKKAFPNKRKRQPMAINGLNNNTKIANLFASNFKKHLFSNQEDKNHTFKEEFDKAFSQLQHES